MIDWENVFHKELPLTSHHRKNILSHLGGQYSINPLLLLSKVIMDQTDIYEYAMKSDEEFRISMKEFANYLSRYDQDFDSQTSKVETTSLEYSLRNALGHDDGLINNFLSICATITEKYDLSARAEMAKQQNRGFKRANDEVVGLELPYAHTECWQLG